MLDLSKHELNKFDNKVWLSSPTMHGEEMLYMEKAYKTNWMSTLGENIDEIEKEISNKIGVKYAVALASGTAALHMCVKLAGERLYGCAKTGQGVLEGHKVICSDMTFAATLNPVAYENGECIFADTERDSWNMDPEALEKAFHKHPDVKLVIVAHLYGTPGKINELKAVCKKHNALLIEDAAESFGATYEGQETGSFGDYTAISFNGNKIITGSSGGMFLTNSEEDAKKVRKWSTQSREAAPWYQHEELGYNYRMSNVIAGVVRGQLPYLDEHIAQKKAIWYRYKEGFNDLPVKMNPWNEKECCPNFWLSCLEINKEAMCKQERTDKVPSFVPEHGKSCPTEILNAIASINAEGRPIWKPMHLQPIYKDSDFVDLGSDVGADIFERGLCLPSDNKMTEAEQSVIIDVIKKCFE